MRISRTAFTRIIAPTRRLIWAALVVVGGILAATSAMAASLTWTNAVSDDWDNPTNWIPPQVPTASDEVIINSGSVTIPTDGAFAIMDWTGGTIAGSLNVTSNGVLNLGGNGNVVFGGSLTNAGTVNWLSGNPQLDDEQGLYPNAGPLVNLASGVWNIQCDEILSGWNSNDGYPYNTNAYFLNEGLVLKTAGTGVTEIGYHGSYAIFFENLGTVQADAGTISFEGGGRLGGTFGAANGAGIDFAAGSFTAAAPTMNGPGTLQLNGGTLTLLNNSVSNLQLASGIVQLGPGFQGGAITNLTLSGATLSGNYTVSGLLDWIGGTIAGSLTVASNGMLNLGGNGNVSIGGALTNAGTVNWLSGSPQLDDEQGLYPNAGPLVNLASGVWNFQCDEILSGWNSNDGYPYNTNAYFLNEGLVLKTAGTGVTEIGYHGSYAIFFENLGTVQADAGTISFEGGGTLGGTFGAANGAGIDFAAGSFAAAAPTMNGPGTLQLNGGTLTLLSNSVANLQLASGIVQLGPGFQGGAITNLTLSGATLSGNYTVSGLLNWIGGTIAGSLTVASNGMLNLGGNGNVSIGGALTNAGTVNWLSGNPLLDNGQGLYPNAGPLVNLASGVWNFQCDEILSGWNSNDGYPYNTNAYFLNEGLVLKTAGTGVTEIGYHGSYAIFFENLGTVQADAGTISFEGGGTLDGTFGAANGAGIDFAAGSFAAAAPTMNGPGTLQLNGGTLTLLSNSVANLQLASGIVQLGPGFQGGAITNLTLSGATLSGNYTVSGLLNWIGGTIAGSLTVASNGMLNLGGNGNVSIGGALTNAGTVNWLSGNPLLDNGQGLYPNAGPLVNLASGVWNFQCDEILSGWNSNDGYPYNTNAYFLNEGLVLKTAGTGVTEIGYHGSYAIFFENLGTVQADAGTISFEGGGTLDGTFGAANGAGIDFAAGSFAAAAPTMNGPGTLQLNGGTLTLLSNSVANLQLASGIVQLGPGFQGGAITNLTLSGATLSGNYTVSGLLNWIGGTIAGSLTVASNGMLNLGGNGNVSIGGALTNAGTVNWLSGNPLLDNGQGLYPNAGPLVNLASGVWNIQCDELLGGWNNNDGYPYNTNAYFLNEGLVLKTAGTGVTEIGYHGSYAIFFENLGTVQADAGTVSFEGGYSDNSSANLAVSLGGAAPGSDYGQIRFLSAPIFAGTFSVVTRDGYLPSSGASFEVLTYPSSTNSFSCFKGMDLGGGILLEPQFSATGLSLLTATYTTNAGLPQLLISQTLGGVVVTWPSGFPGWTLQSTTNIVYPAWTPVSNVCDNEAIVLIIGPQQYFRLKSGN